MKKSIGIKDIVFPAPVFVVGTYDGDNVPNVMTVSWGSIVCSDPLSIGIAVRPQRKTFGNLQAKKAFTISIPGEEHAKEADYFGIEGGAREDKFAVAGMTAERAEMVDAPYVKEMLYNIECEVTQSVDLGAHTLFIGEVKDIKVNEEFLINGLPDWSKIKPLTYDPAHDEYSVPGEAVAKAFSVGKELMNK